MASPVDYLAQVEVALVNSSVVGAFEWVLRWANEEDGFWRARLTLINSDFVEAAEYFIFEAEQIVVDEYRYQWMNADKTILRRRWDCAPHHPELAGFPHHIHEGDEATVRSGNALSITDLLKWLEDELVAPSK